MIPISRNLYEILIFIILIFLIAEFALMFRGLFFEDNLGWYHYSFGLTATVLVTFHLATRPQQQFSPTKEKSAK